MRFCSSCLLCCCAVARYKQQQTNVVVQGAVESRYFMGVQVTLQLIVISLQFMDGLRHPSVMRMQRTWLSCKLFARACWH